MIEPLVTGIVMGLIPVTLFGLYIAAYLQYARGNELLDLINTEENKIKATPRVAINKK